MIFIKILIAGSRSIKEFDLSEHIPKDVELIISGGAEGIDSIAERYSDDKKISTLILRPRYDKYGNAAPIKRNEAMVDIADVVLLIWDGNSRGTMHTLEYAQKKGKTMNLITVERSEDFKF